MSGPWECVPYDDVLVCVEIAYRRRLDLDNRL